MASMGADPRPSRGLLRRFPVTLAFLAILVGVAASTGSLWHRVPHVLIHDAGFRPSDAMALDVARLIGAAWFTTGPRSLLQALLLTTIGVGLLERRSGSVRAAVAFLGLHAVAFLSLGALYLLPATHGLVRDTRDIGASAGYFGVLALVAGGSRGWRWSVGVAVLVAGATWIAGAGSHGVLGRDVNAGAEHTIAILVGGGIGGYLGGRDRARRGPAERHRPAPGGPQADASDGDGARGKGAP